MENLFLVQDKTTGLYLTSTDIKYENENELGTGQFGSKEDAVMVTRWFFSFQLIGLKNFMDCKLIPANN